MKIGFCALAFGCGLLLRCASASADTDVVEEPLMLATEIAGHAEHLETLVVRPTEGTHFPLVLLANGSATRETQPKVRADWLAHLARDFAHRGWLAASVVWRGYGQSTGEAQGNAGTCTAPNAVGFLDAHADDLAAALAVLRERPDVDRSTVLGLGISIGGIAMMDLAARPDRPLAAAINISGGVYLEAAASATNPNCALFEADLVRNVSLFGHAHPVPTLWLYAENDPLFPPAFAKDIATAYRAGGGLADLVIFPPFGTDGHRLFRWEASAFTQPKIDSFLRSNHLPALDETVMAPLIAALTSSNREIAERYLTGVPAEKALATTRDGSRMVWFGNAHSTDEARQQALANCQTQSNSDCMIVAENNHLLDGWQQAFPHQGD